MLTLKVGGFIADGDAALARGDTVAALGDYQSAGQVGADSVGPQIDAAGAPDVTQPLTLAAWGKNGELAAATDAGAAQGIAKQMLVLYQQAITNGMAALGSTQGPFSGALVSAAQAANAAILGDAGYCTSVAQTGSAVNAAVHAFKLAWNAEQSPKVPVGTGNYEAATASALAQVIGSAPAACGARPAPQPAPAPAPQTNTTIVTTSSQGSSWVPWAVGGALLTAAAVGGAVYYKKNKHKMRRRSHFHHRLVPA
jgi:hypothetical protein